MRTRQLLVVAIAVALVVGMAPGGVLGGMLSSDEPSADTTASGAADHRTSAPTGQQLATVIEVSDDAVRGDVESVAFEGELEGKTEAEQAAMLDERAATLRDRSDTLAASGENATESYRTGELSTTEFARQLAVLNARSNTLQAAFERLDEHAEGVSELELRAAGYDRTANENARERLSRLTGTGTTALLEQYTGERTGEFVVEVDDGFAIEVENDDGERTREFERDRPGDGTLVIDRSEALNAAEGVLATDHDGEWLLRSSETDRDDGVYEFAFTFHGPDHVGEAEVSVDGQTGQVFELDEEIESREDGEDVPLSVVVVDGEPGPGETVTLRVTADGVPVEGAVVELDDQFAGETDANGELTVTLPDDDDVDIEVEHGDREGELELEFDEDREDRLERNLAVTGTLENGAVTVTVTYDGDPVDGVSVYHDGFVGVTDEAGRLTFETDATEELELELVKGGFEATVEFEIRDGELEPEDSDVDEGDERLDVAVVDGEPGPGETVTLRVTADGEPLEGAVVELDDQFAGETNANGELTVTLPDDDDVDIEVEHGDREGELELEFDEDREDRED